MASDKSSGSLKSFGGSNIFSMKARRWHNLKLKNLGFLFLNGLWDRKVNLPNGDFVKLLRFAKKGGGAAGGPGLAPPVRA